MKINILVVLSFLLLGACTKEETPPSEPPKGDPDLKVVWQVPLFDSTRSGQLSGHMMTPELFGNTIIGSYYQRLSDDTEDLFAFDKLTGEAKWLWKDFDYSMEGERSLSLNNRPRFEHLMHYSTQEGNYVVDLNSGQTVWKAPGKGFNPSFVDRNREGCFDKYVYQPRQFGSPAGDSIHLYRIDIQTGEKKLIHKTQEVNGLYPTLETPLAWSENGEEFVVFYSHFITYRGPVDGRNDSISLECINVTKGVREWNVSNYDPEGWGNAQGPKMNDGLIYLAGRNTVYCFNPSNGDIIWSHRDESFGSLHTADIVFNDHALFYKSGSGYVKSLDKKSGAVIWEIKDTDISGVSSSRMTYYNEMLVYSDTRLIVLDANTGKNLVKMYSPNESADYPQTRFSHITIDESTGFAYAGDGYFLMCFELPVE